MTRCHALAFALVVFLISGCGSAPLAPVTVPLEYKMIAEGTELTVLDSCAGVSSIQVSDRRTGQTLGKRYSEENKSETFPVTGSGDPVAWARSGVEQGLQKAQVNTAASASERPALVVMIDEITVDESVYRRAEYDARVVLTAELRSRNRSCWRERVDGFAENYGYAGSAENHQETLNHALDRAVLKILNNSAFRAAACKPCR